MNASERARAGEEVRVDLAQIERQLSELWRAEGDASEEGVTKAALWNVVAHTNNDQDRMRATQELGLVSASVPQRTIVIRADLGASSELTSWISANCHLVGGEKQVCSEEISILAGGDRVHHVPSLVNALLVPDMPTAALWVGDLDLLSEEKSYVAHLLEPADRLIVDSAHFDGPEDLEVLSRIGSNTDTIPADLNWVRLEEWRIATASMFDSPQMRQRLGQLKAIRVQVVGADGPFSDRVRALLYIAWIECVLGREISASIGSIERSGRGAIVSVALEFDSGGRVVIDRIEPHGVIVARAEAMEDAWPTVTRYSDPTSVELIVRQLSRRDEDVMYPRVLPIAAVLARRL